jgi:hypothetical protein
MTPTRIFVFGLVLSLGFAVLAAVAPAKPKTPTQAYLDYCAALEKAKTLDEVFPFLSKNFCYMLQFGPKAKEEYPTWLHNLQRDSGEVKDAKITRETITGDTCALEGTGKSNDGTAMKGKINMVREGGAWKVDMADWR